MINLRYHIVSLVAVFLALGMGIVMGSTVIDRVTVDALSNKLDDVRKSVDAIRQENSRLDGQVKQDQQFAESTRDDLLKGHLKGVPVLVVAVAGVDRKPIDDLRAALVTAQATVEGTVWFTSKMRLANDSDTKALATALDLPVDRPDVVRRQALAKVAAARDAGATDAGPLAALSAAGFVTYDGPPPATSTTVSPPSTLGPTLASVPLAGTRYILVSGAGAEVGDDLVGVPLAQALVQASARVVAAESGTDTGQGGRAVFVGLLRSDVVSARLSTVDNLESPMGQTATVLAVEDLAVPRFGQYGVGPGAQRILPTPAT
ncbi:MAG TPA: copper transporter [Acidimicrobiales bacterium]|jgi:hypothetical protein|nr:copper transporter [Acidimicrobiales bacterium]